MRIALVSAIYPPDNWGGIGTYVWHMARGLASIGHNVLVLCGYNSTPSESIEGNIRVVRRIRMDAVTNWERSQQIAELLEAYIERGEIDVVEFAEYGGDGVSFQRRFRTFPTVVKLHAPSRLCAIGDATFARAMARRFLTRPAGRQADRLERESVARAHAVVSPSRWLVEKLRSMGWTLPPNPQIVPNPITLSSPPSLSPQRDYSAQNVLFLGKLTRLKGAALMPLIADAVWRQAPMTRFEIIGQDTPATRRSSWRQTIVSRIPPDRADQLRFRGGIPHGDVANHLARHTVAVFASAFENFPYATLECMAAGIACVVGSGGGAQEIGTHGVNVLKTCREPSAIGREVLRLLGDESLRRSVGAAASAYVHEHYAAKDVARRMTAVYSSAVTSMTAHD